MLGRGGLGQALPGGTAVLNPPWAPRLCISPRGNAGLGTGADGVTPPPGSTGQRCMETRDPGCGEQGCRLAQLYDIKSTAGMTQTKP